MEAEERLVFILYFIILMTESTQRNGGGDQLLLFLIWILIFFIDCSCLVSSALAMALSTGEEENCKDKFFTLTEAEFNEPIKNDDLQSIKELSPAELIDDYNPGPTLPDGRVNFECHCVGHLVASPCGYEFREAISCQKAASDDDLEEGACADEFIRFMECVMRTECFRSRSDDEGESSKDMLGSKSADRGERK